MTLHNANSACDGVVCFAGEDWWYHTHGHNDCQIMKRLARRVPVLWINSIGLRVPWPTTTTVPLCRVWRKVKSTLRGLRRDKSGVWVYSPLFVPRYTSRGAWINGICLSIQVAFLCKAIGIRRPAAWLTMPMAVHAVERGSWARVVVNRCDEFSAFREADSSFVTSLEDRMLRVADDVLYVNRALWGKEAGRVQHAHYIGHGVDFQHFARARPVTGAPASVPATIRDLQRPIVGFFGTLAVSSIDSELLNKVASYLERGTLLLIGLKSMDIAQLEARPNVRYLGPVPYEELPAYAAHFDVGIMPWLQNGWTASINPIKLKEYLALGFPIVTTPLPELKPYEGLMYVGDSHATFLAALGNALVERSPEMVERRRAAVSQDSWDALVVRVAETIQLTSAR